VADHDLIDVSYDRAADAAYIGFTRDAAVRQEQLDDGRVLDYAADVTLVGVEILSPSRGVDLTGIPRASEVTAALDRLGFLVRSPLP
jgi:uncharacterized protein YuzE